MQKVKKQKGPSSGTIYKKNKYSRFQEKVVPPRFIGPTNEVAVNPISDVSRNERILSTRCVLRATTADGRFKARLVTHGLMQRHGTDCAIVAARDKFGRSQNGALDQVQEEGYPMK